MTFLLSVALAADVDHGRYLAALGGCVSCHTEDGGAPWAGGYAIETKFGTFYGPNLTDLDWTEEDFVRAMRRGVSPSGRRYYPAFPYPSYTGMTDADLADLWAFLDTLEPVSRDDERQDPKGIYGWRFLLRFQRAFEFSRGPYDGDDRGEYLVDHVMHCGECHTPRNGIGGLRERRYLSGGDAPSLVDLDWRASDWETLLDLGMLPDGDFVGKEMEAVVEDGTAHLTAEDRAAVIEWLMETDRRR